MPHCSSGRTVTTSCPGHCSPSGVLRLSTNSSHWSTIYSAHFSDPSRSFRAVALIWGSPAPQETLGSVWRHRVLGAPPEVGGPSQRPQCPGHSMSAGGACDPASVSAGCAGSDPGVTTNVGSAVRDCESIRLPEKSGGHSVPQACESPLGAGAERGCGEGGPGPQAVRGSEDRTQTTCPSLLKPGLRLKWVKRRNGLDFSIFLVTVTPLGYQHRHQAEPRVGKNSWECSGLVASCRYGRN